MRELEEVTNQEEQMQTLPVRTLRSGEIVRGVVVYVGQDEVLVDVGAKSEESSVAGIILLRSCLTPRRGQGG